MKRQRIKPYNEETNICKQETSPKNARFQVSTAIRFEAWSQDGVRAVVRNVDIPLHHYTASQPRTPRPEFICEWL